MEHLSQEDVLNLGTVAFIKKAKALLGEIRDDDILISEKTEIRSFLIELFTVADEELALLIRKNVSQRINNILAINN